MNKISEECAYFFANQTPVDDVGRYSVKRVFLTGCTMEYSKEVIMNHKKSMRIFWLSLCLLLTAGALIIAAARYQRHKAEINGSYERQNDGQSVRMTQHTTETDDKTEDAAASFAAKPPVQRENTTADSQTVSGTTTEYRFELKVKDGYLDVYHFHTDNLFFHTGIPYSETTLEQRQELEAGKYFVNEQELYGYLESCTS